MKKKKLLLIYYNLDGFGGINKVLSSLANELIKNYEVTFLLLFREHSNYYHLNPQIKRIYENPYSHWAYKITIFIDNFLKFLPKKESIKAYIFHIGVYLVMKKWLLKYSKNYDIIISSHYKLTSFISTMKFANFKTIAWEHSNYENQGLFKYFHKKYKNLKSIISINSNSASYYKKYHTNSILVPNIIGSPFEEQSYISIEDKEDYILYAGQLVPEKNVKELIEIFIDSHLPSNWKLQIIGEGSLLSSLKKLVQDKDYSDRVLFEGSKNIEEVKKYMEKSKIFCFTSLQESFGLALAEAMFCSNILIAYETDGPRDIINSLNGFLIPFQDKEKFISILQKLIKDKDLLKKLNFNAYKESQKRKKEELIRLWCQEIER